MASPTKLPDADTYWKIFREVDEELKCYQPSVDRKFVRSRVLKRFAAYYRMPEENINHHEQHPLCVSIANLTTLLCPKTEKAKQNLRRELALDKNLPYACALEIARGNISSREEDKPPRTKKIGIELAVLLDSVCELALRHGYSSKEISSALELAKKCVG